MAASTTERPAMAGHPAGPGRAAMPGHAAMPHGDTVAGHTTQTGRLARLRLPAHVGVLLGASTAAYAVTLAAVTGLQATSEADLAAERAPAVAGVQDLGARNQTVSDALTAAGQRYDKLARDYAVAGGRLTNLEAALADLATNVQAIDGVSRTLPASVPLPKVTRVSVAAPATSATTGASGAPPP